MESAENGLQKKGWALKRGDILPQWNRRYFICDPFTCRLLYFREKPADEEKENPRGALNLTDCIVTITSGVDPEEDQCRFTITTKDRAQTYNLQVADRKELKEWTHALHLLSKLGGVRDVVVRENKGGDIKRDPKTVLQLSAEKLLRGFERKAGDCRDGLTRVAEQKWKAKCRLGELLKQLNRGQAELQKKYGNLEMQEKELRERMHFLTQKEFFLHQEVSKSNDFQERVVGAFYSEVEKLEEKALLAMKQCLNDKDGNPVLNLDSQPAKDDALYNDDDDEKGVINKQPLPEPTNFRYEMLKIILEQFPSTQQHLPKTLAHLVPAKPKPEDELPANLTGTEKALFFFHLYFTRIHVTQEERLIRVRTQCQRKFHELKWITRQRELIKREQAELNWIIDEMKRAINRLTKEGVPLGPGEIEDLGQGNGALTREQQTENYGADTVVPIRAHRATWSEASDVIFKLNFNRQEQFERTQELEGALKLRESLREFLGTLKNLGVDGWKKFTLSPVKKE